MSCKRWWWRGNDDQTGTSGRDWLFGGRRDNFIDGRGGNDFIWAGRGDDTILGGEGSDLIFAGSGDDIVEGGDGDDRVYAGRGHDEVNAGAGNDKVYAGRGDDVVIHNVSENEGSKDYYNGGRGTDVLVLQMSHAEYSSVAVQADLAALTELMAQQGGYWGGRAFQFEAFNLKIRNFERYEIEYTDSVPVPAPTKPQVPPDAQDDKVFVEPGLVAITEVESNDPSGLPLTGAAQVIDRSSFRVESSADVGDDTLPRVSIIGTIGDSPDPTQGPNPNDVDLYSITLRAGEKLILDIDYGFDPMSGNSLISQLFVQDSDGNVLAENYQSPVTAGGGGSMSVFDSYLEFTDSGSGGTYYFSVSSFDNDPASTPGEFNDGGLVTGDYVLNVSIDNAAPDLGGFVIKPDELLANDSDADGDALSITSVGNAVNGEVELTSSGDILFKPAENAPGSFEYTISDGNGGESTATVTVNGNPIVGTEFDDVLASTSEADLFVGGGGSDTFNFAGGAGNDTIADFELGTDLLAITDGIHRASAQETSNNDTLVSFDTGDSVLLVGVTGVTDPNDLFA
jgi:Ca2+-binding RTX toxin-like protein